MQSFRGGKWLATSARTVADPSRNLHSSAIFIDNLIEISTVRQKAKQMRRQDRQENDEQSSLDGRSVLTRSVRPWSPSWD